MAAALRVLSAGITADPDAPVPGGRPLLGLRPGNLAAGSRGSR